MGRVTVILTPENDDYIRHKLPCKQGALSKYLNELIEKDRFGTQPSTPAPQ